MNKNKNDKRIDFLRKCHRTLINPVEFLADDHKHIAYLFRDLEEDISEVQESEDKQAKINLATSLAILNLRADSALESAKAIKKITGLMENAIAQMGGLDDEQE